MAYSAMVSFAERATPVSRFQTSLPRFSIENMLFGSSSLAMPVTSPETAI